MNQGPDDDTMYGNNNLVQAPIHPVTYDDALMQRAVKEEGWRENEIIVTRNALYDTLLLSVTLQEDWVQWVNSHKSLADTDTSTSSNSSMSEDQEVGPQPSPQLEIIEDNFNERENAFIASLRHASAPGALLKATTVPQFTTSVEFHRVDSGNLGHSNPYIIASVANNGAYLNLDEVSSDLIPLKNAMDKLVFNCQEVEFQNFPHNTLHAQGS